MYYGLNALAKKYNPNLLSKCSLKILGVPCNQFGYQEPGENLTEIVNCLKWVRPGNHFVPAFRLLAKRDVNGKNESELYSWLKSACPNPNLQIMERNIILYSPVRTTDITWNFEKFLLDHNGKPVKRYDPQFLPINMEEDIDKLINACEKAS